MTRPLSPGQTVPIPFTVSETPDSTPTVTVYQSTAAGVLSDVSATTAPTVTLLSGLAYHAYYTVPAAAVHGSAYRLLVSVVIGGETTTHWLDGGTVALWASQASVTANGTAIAAVKTDTAAIRDKTDQISDPATEVALTVNTGVGAGGKLYFRKADGFDETFAVAGALAADDRIVVTVKADRKNDADAAAILKWDSAVGLVCIEGAAATAADGSVAIVDATARTIRLILAANAAASLIPRTNAAHYDVKRFPASGEPYGVAVGNASIAHAVTHET